MRPARSLSPCLPLVLLLWTLCAVGPGGGPGPLGPGSARAEDAPAALEGEALQVQVRLWIAELRSDQFETREAARAGLKSHGLRAREVLEAAAEDEDPEVRRTILALLQGAPSQVAAPSMREGDFESLGRVSVDYVALPLSEALKDLGGRIGARFHLPEGTAEQPITLAHEDTPAFEVLASVLTQVGLDMPSGFAEDGSVTLQPMGTELRGPRAAAGPLELRVKEISVTRTLGAEGSRKYGVTFDVRWLPLVHVQHYESARLEVARDPEGRAWGSGSSGRSTTTYGVGRGEMSRTVVLALEPSAPGGPEHLGVLQVVLPLRLRYAGVKILVGDLDTLPLCRDGRGREVEPQTPGSVLFKSLLQPQDSPAQWVAELRAWLPEGVEQDSLELLALDAAQNPVRMLVYGGRSRSADGTVSLTARTIGRQAERPVQLGATWFAREEQGSLRFRLSDVPLR